VLVTILQQCEGFALRNIVPGLTAGTSLDAASNNEPASLLRRLRKDWGLRWRPRLTQLRWLRTGTLTSGAFAIVATVEPQPTLVPLRNSLTPSRRPMPGCQIVRAHRPGAQSVNTASLAAEAEGRARQVDGDGLRCGVNGEVECFQRECTQEGFLAENERSEVRPATREVDADWPYAREVSLCAIGESDVQGAEFTGVKAEIPRDRVWEGEVQAGGVDESAGFGPASRERIFECHLRVDEAHLRSLLAPGVGVGYKGC
jgi:hypothetical protein